MFRRTYRLLLSLPFVLVIGAPGSAASAADDPPRNGQPDDRAKDKADRLGELALPGEDPPVRFVPRVPRSVPEQRRVEALRDYSAARALEDNRALSDAIALLEDALKLEPDSAALLRRLSRLAFMKQNNADQALKYSRRVLELEPGDTDTISRLVTYYNRKRDMSGLESLLKQVLANRELAADAPGRLLAEFELGKLYANQLEQVDKAADAFAKVVEGLDEKAANRLTPVDQKRILGDDPEEAYLDFGNVFFEAKRYDLAVRAFERGLVYKENHPQLQLRLSEALLKQGKADEALALVETFLKRQPGGTEGYELLKQVLTSLKRENEITPRLEQAAKEDSKNLPVQYLLADRYREIGQVDRAESMYKELLAAQPTPDGYKALAASLLRRRKADELLKVFVEAVPRPGGLEAVKPQIEAVIKDPALAEAMLDAGLKMVSAEPPQVDPQLASNILATIAAEAGKADKAVPILQARLKQNLNVKGYLEVTKTLGDLLKKYGEAAAALEAMLAKFPEEKSGPVLAELGRFKRGAGKYEAAVETLREAIKLEPNRVEIQVELAKALSQAGKLDEAIEIFKTAVKNNPNNEGIEFEYAQVLTQYNRNEEAIALYKGLLERNANNETLVHFVRQGLSIAYVNMGDYAKGEAELEMIYEHDPDEPGVNNDLGYLYADQGKNLEKAESMIRKALKEKPDEAAYLDSLGWVLFKRGKLKEAVEPLEKAVKRLTGGGDATIYEHLGDVYFKLQDHAKARAAWEQAEKAAVKVVPADKRLPEIRKKLESLTKLAPAPKPAEGDTP